MSSHSIFVHIVTYNSESYISSCLNALLTQKGVEIGKDFKVVVTDNSSKDSTLNIVSEYLPDEDIVCNKHNLGFAAAHNQGVAAFLDSPASFFVVLNPDVKLREDALEQMVKAFGSIEKCDCITPLLFRADDKLDPVKPAVIDAAGMYFTCSIRHLDRGSGELDVGRYRQNASMIGGTGAFLMLSRSAVCELLLRGEKYDTDLFHVYPELKEGFHSRAPLFDEAFFAYREDADLAWRAAILGCNCVFVPSVVAFHRRRVTADNRSELPDDINRWSVRNRFLMQVNNLSFSRDKAAFFKGVLIRNLVVVGGVLIRERSSFGAFIDLFKLIRRALERRQLLFDRAKKKNSRPVF